MLLRRYHRVKAKPVGVAKEQAETKPIGIAPLNSYTVVKLKGIAKNKGIEGYSTMKKAELIEVLDGD